MIRINNLRFNWQQASLIQKSAIAAMILLVSLLFLPSCNSGVGGSTGGNPLQSSLPLQISTDAH